jgi:multidrug efflux pump subunit AcrA (membrane-fusion protein)
VAWWIDLSEIVRNFRLLAAAIVGIVLAGMRVVAANRQAEASLGQAELTRRTHVADLFNRAVEQLDHDKLQVRLGAIYTLRQISADYPDLTGAVFELLSLYVRHLDTGRGGAEAPPDIKEIVRILKGVR